MPLRHWYPTVRYVTLNRNVLNKTESEPVLSTIEWYKQIIYDRSYFFIEHTHAHNIFAIYEHEFIELYMCHRLVN